MAYKNVINNSKDSLFDLLTYVYADIGEDYDFLSLPARKLIKEVEKDYELDEESKKHFKHLEKVDSKSSHALKIINTSSEDKNRVYGIIYEELDTEDHTIMYEATILYIYNDSYIFSDILTDDFVTIDTTVDDSICKFLEDPKKMFEKSLTLNSDEEDE